MGSQGVNTGDFPLQIPTVSSSSDTSNHDTILRSRSHQFPILNNYLSRPIHRRQPLTLSTVHNISIMRVYCRKYISSSLSTSDGVSTRAAVIIFATVFVCSILSLAFIYFRFPELQPEERQHIKLPLDVEQAKDLGRVLEKHKDRHYYEVLAAIIVTYIFLQTFAIPGSISLSILSGFLYPFPLALALVCFCSATGASFCYMLSHMAGRRLVYKYFPDRALQYSLTVQKHKEHIFNYILFLRITPFLPNWFINIAAPIVNVPLYPFWIGTFLGVAPPSFVAIQAGQTLQQLTSMSGSWSWLSVGLLAVFSLLSLLPVLLRERLRSKYD